MSRNLFEPLSDGVFVFRLAETGKSFLPKGARLPNADFFRPSTDDEEEAERIGRPPGLSVWDRGLTNLEDAKRIRFAPEDSRDRVRAFGLLVQTIKSIGMERRRELGVVAVPLPTEEGPGADGHAHIEGFARAPGESRPLIKGLRAALADACTEVA